MYLAGMSDAEDLERVSRLGDDELIRFSVRAL
jgi:hypothetical protein